MTDGPGPISSTMAIAASALHAQQSRMRVIAENIANADSTSATPGGAPYQRQVPVFTPDKVQPGATGVKMAGVRSDPTPFRSEYNPGHPAANAKGYLQLPNVDPLVEALDMKEAQRAYDANLNVIDAARAMTLRTLDIIKK